MITGAGGILLGALIASLVWAVPVTADRNDKREVIAELRGQLGKARQEADYAQGEVEELTEELQKSRRQIDLLSAEGEVPDFTGRTAHEARKLAEPYEWEIKVKKQATDDAKPGVVIAQSVPEGKKLSRGRSITLTVAEEPPPEWETVASFSGNGAMNTDEFKLPAGKARVSYNFTGDSNTIIELIDPNDPLGGDLLLNEIGARSGTTRVYQPPGIYYFEIEGEGPWTVELQVFG